MPEMTVQLKPWRAPNFVRYANAPDTVIGIHISDVPADVLAKLCDDFRAEVFRKAGKVDPRG